MTRRTDKQQRKLERKAARIVRMGGRIFSRKTTGLDGLAKRMVLRRTGGGVPHDPELDHPADWDRPID